MVLFNPVLSGLGLLVIALQIHVQSSSAQSSCPAVAICTDPMDIVFLLDSTEHVGKNFEYVKKLVAKIVVELDINGRGAKVAVIQIGSEPTADILLNTSQDLDALLSEIKSLQPKGGSRNIAQALQVARETVLGGKVSPNSPAPDIIVLVTSGPNEASGASFLIDQIEANRLANIECIAVGETPGAPMEFLIQFSPKKQYVVFEPSYSELPDTMDEVLGFTCCITAQARNTVTPLPPPLPADRPESIKDEKGAPGSSGGAGQKGQSGNQGDPGLVEQKRALGLKGAAGQKGSEGDSGPTGLSDQDG